MTNEELKKIREHIERTVTHIAREYQTNNDVVWKQMLLAAVDHTQVTDSQINNYVSV